MWVDVNSCNTYECKDILTEWLKLQKLHGSRKLNSEINNIAITQVIINSYRAHTHTHSHTSVLNREASEFILYTNIRYCFFY